MLAALEDVYFPLSYTSDLRVWAAHFLMHSKPNNVYMDNKITIRR
jgi:hypothetical protein